jgi:hypothetical protein
MAGAVRRDPGRGAGRHVTLETTEPLPALAPYALIPMQILHRDPPAPPPPKSSLPSALHTLKRDIPAARPPPPAPGLPSAAQRRSLRQARYICTQFCSGKHGTAAPARPGPSLIHLRPFRRGIWAFNPAVLPSTSLLALVTKRAARSLRLTSLKKRSY